MVVMPRLFVHIVIGAAVCSSAGQANWKLRGFSSSAGIPTGASNRSSADDESVATAVSSPRQLASLHDITWTNYRGCNAYRGHGARPVDSDWSALKYVSEEHCKQHCLENRRCRNGGCVVYYAGGGFARPGIPARTCWRRMNCVPDEFDCVQYGRGYTTFVPSTLTATPTLVPTPAPTLATAMPTPMPTASATSPTLMPTLGTPSPPLPTTVPLPLSPTSMPTRSSSMPTPNPTSAANSSFAPWPLPTREPSHTPGIAPLPERTPAPTTAPAPPRLPTPTPTASPSLAPTVGNETPACLCVFDIDRTLTGRQGATRVCRNNRELDGVYDDGYGGGTATLSEFAAEGLSKTFCNTCYLGIVSAGHGSGEGSNWNNYLLTHVMRNPLQDSFMDAHPRYRMTWSYGTNVHSPYVLGQHNKQKQNSVLGIVKWYARRGVDIRSANVYFFGDRTENIMPFKLFGFNSREISCASRDWHHGGRIGYCGATVAEITRRQGNILCQNDLTVNPTAAPTSHVLPTLSPTSSPLSPPPSSPMPVDTPQASPTLDPTPKPLHTSAPTPAPISQPDGSVLAPTPEPTLSPIRIPPSVVAPTHEPQALPTQVPTFVPAPPPLSTQLPTASTSSAPTSGMGR